MNCDQVTLDALLAAAVSVDVRECALPQVAELQQLDAAHGLLFRQPELAICATYRLQLEKLESRAH